MQEKLHCDDAKDLCYYSIIYNQSITQGWQFRWHFDTTNISHKRLCWTSPFTNGGHIFHYFGASMSKGNLNQRGGTPNVNIYWVVTEYPSHNLINVHTVILTFLMMPERKWSTLILQRSWKGGGHFINAQIMLSSSANWKNDRFQISACDC